MSYWWHKTNCEYCWQYTFEEDTLEKVVDWKHITFCSVCYYKLFERKYKCFNCNILNTQPFFNKNLKKKTVSCPNCKNDMTYAKFFRQKDNNPLLKKHLHK